LKTVYFNLFINAIKCLAHMINDPKLLFQTVTFSNRFLFCISFITKTRCTFAFII